MEEPGAVWWHEAVALAHLRHNMQSSRSFLCLFFAFFERFIRQGMIWHPNGHPVYLLQNHLTLFFIKIHNCVLFLIVTLLLCRSACLKTVKHNCPGRIPLLAQLAWSVLESCLTSWSFLLFLNHTVLGCDVFLSVLIWNVCSRYHGILPSRTFLKRFYSQS